MMELDLGDAADRACFDLIHLRAYDRIARACDRSAAEATPVLARTLDALSASGPSDPDAPGDDPRLPPDAVAYVTLGSQLGLTVLRKRIAPDARTGLFSLEPDLAAWKAFLRRIEVTPPSPESAARICQDALRAFDIFLSEADRQLSARRQATV
ncbi:hypothetical protein [Pseudooceanicola nanhaiensis]|uniref:hypothetical protein n=1 Tax=Pseudooceanicola nanhaiensis TaxID=375761 RepID=UPI00405A299A